MQSRVGERSNNFNKINAQRETIVDSKNPPRVAATLDSRYHGLLNKLSKLCDLNRSTLAREIVECMLVNPDFLEYIQKKYRVSNEEKIFPIFSHGKCYYK